MKPMIFSPEKTQLILDSRMTRDRRYIIPQPYLKNGYWRLGDTAWSEYANVLNIVSTHPLADHSLCRDGDIVYVREFPGATVDEARLFLRISGLRAARLQAVTGYDVLAEGIDNGEVDITAGEQWEIMQTKAYKACWENRNPNSLYSWDANPWTWVYIFKRISRGEAEDHANESKQIPS